MNSGYFPGIVNPKVRPQTKSDELQTPFFFGGSQIPNALSIKKGEFSKSSVKQKDITSTKGSQVFHQDGKFVKMFGRAPFKKNGIY